MPKLGIGLGIASNKGGALKKLLGALYLQPSSVLDNVSPGALIATVQGTRAGSSLTLTGNAAGMFTLTGDEVFVAGDLDYATAQSHQIEVTETNAAYPNSPRASALTINVLDSTVVTLSALTLSAATISEGAASGAIVGALQGATGGSTLSLVDDAGGRFAIASGSIVAGLTGLDYETATSHQITVRETHPNATNSPRDTVLTISVTNVAEVTLSALSLSASTIPEGAANGTTVGQVQGTTAGSTLSLLDSAGGLFALDAGYIEKAGALDYETATSHSITIRETHPDAAAPRDTVLSLTVSNVLEVTLAPLTLSAATLAEGAAENTAVGTVQGKSTGSTLALFDDAGGRFKLTGTSLVAGPTATDYSVATSHNITLREAHADGSNSPRDTVLAISITEVVVVEPDGATMFTTETPTTFADEAGDYEFGMQFEPTQAGTITGLRYYRAPGDAGDTETRTLRLWNNGTQAVLGTATITSSPGQEGWQTAVLDTPVAVAPGTVYTVSYSYVRDGANDAYPFTSAFFAGEFISADGLLTAPTAAGKFNTTPGFFPASSFNDANYWLDIRFAADEASEPAPIARFTTASFDGTSILSDTIGTNHLTLDGPVPATVDGMLSMTGAQRFRRQNPTGLPAGTATVTEVLGVVFPLASALSFSVPAAGYGSNASAQMCSIAVRRRRLIMLGFGTSSDALTEWGTALGQPIVLVQESSATGRKLWANDVLIAQDGVVLNKGAAWLLLGGVSGGSTAFNSLPMKFREFGIYDRALTDAERAAITTRLLGEMPTVATVPLEIITGETFAFEQSGTTYQTIDLVDGAVGAIKLTYTGNTSGLTTPDFATLTATMEGADGALTLAVEDLAGRTDSDTLAIVNNIARPVPKTGPAITVKSGQSVSIFASDYFDAADEGDTPLWNLQNSSVTGDGTLTISADFTRLIYTAGSTLGAQTVTARAFGSASGNYTTTPLAATVEVFSATIGEAVINEADTFSYIPYDAGETGSTLIKTGFTSQGALINTSSTVDNATVPGSVPILHHVGSVDGGITAGSVLTARLPIVVSETLPTAQGQWVNAAAADAALQALGVLQHTRAAGENPEFPLTVTNAVGVLNRRLTTGPTAAWGGEQLVALNGTRLFAPTNVTPDANEFFGYGVFVRGASTSNQILFQMGQGTQAAPYACQIWLNGGTRLNVQFFNGLAGSTAFFSAAPGGAQVLAEGERCAFFIRVKLDGAGGGEMVVQYERRTAANVRVLYTLNDNEAVTQPLKFADFETYMFGKAENTQLWTSPFAAFGFWLDPTFDTSNFTTLKSQLVDMDTPLANGQSGALANGTLTMKDPASWLPTLGQPTRLITGPAAEINAGKDAGSAPNFTYHEPDAATSL